MHPTSASSTSSGREVRQGRRLYRRFCPELADLPDKYLFALDRAEAFWTVPACGRRDLSAAGR